MCQICVSDRNIGQLYPYIPMRVNSSIICGKCSKIAGWFPTFYCRPIGTSASTVKCPECFRFYEGEP
jgi:hypothetical protein